MGRAASSSQESKSLWQELAPDSARPRASLAADDRADVVIVGAGYTGLWTAHYLSCLDPERRIVVVEAQVAGFGASGRNGGWCTGTLSGIEGLLAKPERRDAGLALQRAVYDAVDEVGRVAEKEGIDCHYRKGGSLHLATTEAQHARLDAEVRTLAALGLGSPDHEWLSAEQAQCRLRLSQCFGASFTPHCAALHPRLLVRGLADSVERRGVCIFEKTPVLRIEPGRVLTPLGEVRAPIVLRATEAYTTRLAGLGRRLAPLHSLMIATEPLDQSTWASVGLADRETFGDGRRITIYGQRTADDRLAFGARGDYRFGSGIQDRFEASDPRFERIRQILLELLPQLEGARITHRWGGALGVPRSWRPSVGLDRSSGLGWAGGYVGQGVAASNLAGRTLAELVVGADTERCGLAWVAPESREWEPEPLRWLAINGVTRIGDSADRAEWAGARTPRLARVFDWFVSK